MFEHDRYDILNELAYIYAYWKMHLYSFAPSLKPQGLSTYTWLAMAADGCQRLLGMGNASAISEFSDAENARDP